MIETGTRRTDGAYRHTRPHALRFRALDGGSAVAWRTNAGWTVQSKDVLLRGRVDAALHRAVAVARTHTEPDGERVLDGWEEVSPTDSRYPTLFVLQAARLGLTDVEVDVVTREGRAAVDAAESRE